MMKFTGMILDIDGTIWNTTPIVAEAWNEVLRKSDKRIPLVTSEILQSQFGKTMDVIASNLFANATNSEKIELMKNCCEAEQKALGKNQKNIMYDGVFETISRLCKTVPIYIVSNCQNGYIELMLEKTEMKSFVKDFECFGNTGKSKAFNIKLILKRNSIEKPVYVGDTQGDADACKEANVPFIWASYGFGKVEIKDYCKTIKSFRELEGYVK